MTDTELPAGRELDAMVAEKVMGWPHECRLIGTGTTDDPWGLDHPGAAYRVRSDSDQHWDRWSPGGAERIINPWLPYYSTSIADAWAVVEKMLAEWEVLINDEQGQWEVSFWEGHRSKAERYNVVEVASTAPLAICRVALRAVQGHTTRSEHEGGQPAPTTTLASGKA